MIGIYKITSPSGKIYIGQSTNINSRIRKYRNNNCKNQVRLYNSILSYGFENHSFEIIEECFINELNEKERFWQDYYNSTGNEGLNCKLTETDSLSGKHSEETKSKIGFSNKGKKRSAEQIENMSIVMKGKFSGEKHPMYGKNHTKEAKDKISESKKGNKNMLGKNHSDESKEKISNSLKGFKHTEESKIKISKGLVGRKVSIETRKKISESNKGTVFSKERRAKISNALKGRVLSKECLEKRSKSISGENNYKSKLVLDLDSGIYYYCVREAAVARNINISTLNNYLNGNRPNKTSLIYV